MLDIIHVNAHRFALSLIRGELLERKRERERERERKKEREVKQAN